jgi:hypothetical protein
MSENKRLWLVAIYLQLGIRLRYLFETWFGFKALFSPTTAYPSKWRPKNCPKYDFVTQTGFIWIWLITAWSRDFGIVYAILCKIGVISLFNKIHDWLSNRLIAQMKAAGYSNADREIAIPEYDFKKGNAEEFYQTFVKRPHPVILRGFMKKTPLLKELSWDKVLSTYGEETVYLTKREIDGFPGKLKEVNNPNVYLHNSEALFNKYPHIR